MIYRLDNCDRQTISDGYENGQGILESVNFCTIKITIFLHGKFKWKKIKNLTNIVVKSLMVKL